MEGSCLRGPFECVRPLGVHAGRISLMPIKRSRRLIRNEPALIRPGQIRVASQSTSTRAIPRPRLLVLILAATAVITIVLAVTHGSFAAAARRYGGVVLRGARRQFRRATRVSESRSGAGS